MTAWTYRRTLLAATLLVCFLTAAFGQTGGTGVLRGTVYDPARATVPQAKVVLTQVATNIVREVPANEVGFFLFAGLAPGEYTLTVEFSGFKKWTGRLQMVAGQTAVAEPVLEVGSVEAAV